MTDPRRTRKYRGMREIFRAGAVKRDDPCWICGLPIDYHAPAFTADAWELDHAKPVDKYPELAYDYANFRSSHCSCNRSKNDSLGVMGLGERVKRL